MTFSHLPPPGVGGHIWGPQGPGQLSHPARGSPVGAGDACRPEGGLGLLVSRWVLWGEGQAPIQWDSETLGCSSVSHCVMTCVCLCVCFCARACAHARPRGSTGYKLLPQTCPCLLPARIWGDGYTWQASGAEKSGQPSLRTSSCPLLPTMSGHARQPRGVGAGVERGSHHSPVTSFSVTVCPCMCVYERVCSLDSDSARKRALWIM